MRFCFDLVLDWQPDTGNFSGTGTDRLLPVVSESTSFLISTIAPPLTEALRSVSGPIRTRCRRFTLYPSAAKTRRTCRFNPCVSTTRTCRGLTLTIESNRARPSER